VGFAKRRHNMDMSALRPSRRHRHRKAVSFLGDICDGYEVALFPSRRARHEVCARTLLYGREFGVSYGMSSPYLLCTCMLFIIDCNTALLAGWATMNLLSIKSRLLPHDIFAVCVIIAETVEASSLPPKPKRFPVLCCPLILPIYTRSRSRDVACTDRCPCTVLQAVAASGLTSSH
jgi:hypothetical protein